ncbi:phage portal protein [Candidatus Poribacteria bacterium]|nr:phage portal protein [Candidatus Poribacteria bacterium]
MFDSNIGGSGMNMVKESFLRWLHYQQNHERLTNYAIYDAYYNGDHEVNIPPKVKSALESELGTVNNYCRLVVDSSVDYICGDEIGIEIKPRNIVLPEEDRELSSKAESLLYHIYDENQLLYEEMLKTVTIMGKKGDVFLKLYIENNKIKVRVLRPDICFPKYRSDDYKEMLYCAVKWFDEEENRENGMPLMSSKKWKAQVFRADTVEYYELGESSETEYSEWKLIDVQDNIFGFIPIIHIKNTVDDLDFGVSDLQVMTDLQDALNKTITDMLLAMDNQAFQRMFIFGGQSPKGQEISMEPGMITEVPNESGRLEVVPSADMAPFIEVMREIVGQICSVTSIPRVAFSKGSGVPISGYALRLHYIPLERKCMKKKIILKNRFSELNKMIFYAAKLLDMGDYTGFNSKIRFTGGLPVDEEARIKVQEMEIRNKLKSRRTVMQERGIEDIDAELDQIRIEEIY